jgi:hypothetical protein
VLRPLAPLTALLCLVLAAPASAALSIDISSARSPMIYGDRGWLEVRGADGAGSLVLYADEFPYDGVQQEVGRLPADERGDARFPIRPVRNTRFRVVREDTGESAEREVHADLRKELRFGVRSVRVRVTGPPDSIRSLRARVLYARYNRPLRVVARGRLRRVSRTTVQRTFRMPRRIPGDGGLVCLLEPRDNGHGPPARRGRDCQFEFGP